MSLKENYNRIAEQIPEGVQLVAVSKTQPIEAIKEIYDLDQKVFGENKVQELVDKASKLPSDIKWRLIGHLQINKVKYIVSFVDLIESIDSEKILLEIDKEAKKHNRIIKVLLQIHIAQEETKFGLSVEEAKIIFNNFLTQKYENVDIIGLMGMATFTDNQKQVKEEFASLKLLFDELSKQKELTTLSMGMSGDFQLAIESGSNSVRIGSSIFGSRV